METNHSTALIIQEHDFQNAKNQLKKYVSESASELSLPTVPSSGGLFGLGDHKVTGEELNEVISQIQEYFFKVNKLTQGLVSEFGQVYKAFESLDKDYISGIVGSIRAAEKVSEEEQKDRADIKKIVERLNKSVDVLKRFKEDIDELKHIADVDKAWELISHQEEMIDSLWAYKDSLSGLSHLMDTDDIWRDVASLKNGFSEIGGSVSEIQNLIQGLDSALAETRVAISNQQSKQQVFEKEIDKKMSDYRVSVDQELHRQSTNLKNHEEYLESTLKSSQAEMARQFDAFAEKQNRENLDLQKAQTDAFEHFSCEQETAIESMRAAQNEKMASISEKMEEEKISLQEKVALLKQKLKISYIIAGSAGALTLIHFVLNITGVL